MFAVIVCMVVRTLFPLVAKLVLGSPSVKPVGFGGFFRLHCVKHGPFMMMLSMMTMVHGWQWSIYLSTSWSEIACLQS